MKRLVYSPIVKAYIKSDFLQKVVDISPYIVSGSLNRKVNQVSGAQITLRNPVNPDGNMLWTEQRGSDGKIGPAFHPMDPIVITMTRLQAHSVQVFTGYLDKAPYIQLYPGLCTIEASCTLKRLLYTQWDAALPFVDYFLSQYGWVLNPEFGTSTLTNPTAEGKKIPTDAKKIKAQFSDGSIGSLLYAVLTIIGEWDPSTIWIEALPSQMTDIINGLYSSIAAETKQGVDLFKGMIEGILAANQSQGTGAPAGAPGAAAGSGRLASGAGLTIRGQAIDSTQLANLNTSLDVAAGLSANQHVMEAMVYAGIAENSWYDNTSPNNTSHMGVFQSTAFHPGQLAEATKAFLTGGPSFQGGGAIAYEKGNPGASLDTIATTVEAPGVGAYQAESGSGAFAPESVAIVAAYLKGAAPAAGGTLSGSTAPTNTAATPAVTPNTQAAGNSPGGATGAVGGVVGGASGTVASGYVNPIGKGAQFGGRIDQGVDYCGVFPFFAIGNATVLSVGNTWGWPSTTGGGIVYKLLDGPRAGTNVYIMEDVRIVGGIKGGDHLTAGQHIMDATGGPTCTETGWALPDGSNALASAHSLPASHYSAEGQDFFDFVKNLSSGGQGTVGPGSTATGGSGSGGSSVASAFATYINLPSIFQQAEALSFRGKRSFIADMPLFPFIEQLCQASMRNFMSMPNGNFFAFFPDYFGLYGRKYYWEIRDIEIMDGRIDLSDDPLVTHVAIAGDVTQFHNTVDVNDLIQTSGIFTIFDALATGFITGLQTGKVGLPNFTPTASKTTSTSTSKAGTQSKGKSTKQIEPSKTDKQTALAFLQKYGARPLVEEIPAIRSPFFELFFAFQKFMLLWAKQFQTTFEITFMPELFPGGLIAFPDHHIQCYVEEVVHNFDYTNGFTTTVNLSSPSVMDGSSRPNISEGLVHSGLASAVAAGVAGAGTTVKK